ncbi:hypothetical protein [Spongiimicrobium sp. 2-473A-2-J]|uniref:hypothetical protein n=1 Tax=Eudoraea algarum TaxID=3417568 RepID=UPI003D361A85
MKSIFILLFFSILFQSFGQNSELNLNNYFSETEIADLNRMTDFFQSELCGKTDRIEFGECLMVSFPENRELFQYCVSGQISYRKQKKLYKTLNNSTFKKIWALCPSTILITEPEYEYQSICFSGDTQFLAFIKALGEQNEYLKYYGQKLERIGGFDSGTFLSESIIGQSEKWNLDNRNVQIFLAIHYLTHNDLENRDKKAKRLEKRYNRDMIKKIKKTAPNKGYNL